MLPSLAVALSFVLAQPPKAAYPEPGGDLPGPFHVYHVTGKKKGTWACLVSRHELHPTVMVVVKGTKVTDGLKYLLTKLDNAIDKNPNTRLGGFVVFLPENIKDVAREDDAREKLEAEVEDLYKEMSLKHLTFGFDVKEKLAPYKIDDAADVFVLIYNKLRVVSIHAMPRDALQMEQAKKILAEVAEKLGAKRG
jgi:hypothetical protein